MKNVLENGHMWLAGVVLAAAGVLLARWVAPHVDGGARLPLVLVGQLLAVGGLCVICLGVSRRVRRERELGESELS